MTKKATSIVAYLTIIGWLIAYVAGDKVEAKFHLNQGLVLGIGYIVANLLGRIPFIGWIISAVLGIFLFVCFIIGIVGAFQDQEKEMPIIGSLKLLK